MQQWPLFRAQICHNSRIIEKVHFGRSPQDVTFPSNNQMLFCIFSIQRIPQIHKFQ